MLVDLEPVGRGSIARVELTNDADRDVPYEIRMMLGEISEAGELRLTPADEDFLVFPAQAIVEANSQQVFRIQYVGDPSLLNSRIYYASIRQVPIELEGSGAQVQFVVNFNVLVSVVPRGAVPDAIVEEVSAVTAENVPGIQVRLSNAGNRYFLAGSADWDISATAEDGSQISLEYRNNDMSQNIGSGVVAPGRARIFFIPTEKPLVQNSIRIQVEP